MRRGLACSFCQQQRGANRSPTGGEASREASPTAGEALLSLGEPRRLASPGGDFILEQGQLEKYEGTPMSISSPTALRSGWLVDVYMMKCNH